MSEFADTAAHQLENVVFCNIDRTVSLGHAVVRWGPNNEEGPNTFHDVSIVLDGSSTRLDDWSSPLELPHTVPSPQVDFRILFV